MGHHYEEMLTEAYSENGERKGRWVVYRKQNLPLQLHIKEYADLGVTDSKQGKH